MILFRSLCIHHHYSRNIYTRIWTDISVFALNVKHFATLVKWAGHYLNEKSQIEFSNKLLQDFRPSPTFLHWFDLIFNSIRTIQKSIFWNLSYRKLHSTFKVWMKIMLYLFYILYWSRFVIVLSEISKKSWQWLSNVLRFVFIEIWNQFSDISVQENMPISSPNFAHEIKFCNLCSL